MIDLSSQIALKDWKSHILLEEHTSRQDFNQLFRQTKNLSQNPDSMWKFKTAPSHIHTTFIDHTGEILTGNGNLPNNQQSNQCNTYMCTIAVPTHPC